MSTDEKRYQLFKVYPDRDGELIDAFDKDEEAVNHAWKLHKKPLTRYMFDDGNFSLVDSAELAYRREFEEIHHIYVVYDTHTRAPEPPMIPPPPYDKD